MEFVALLAFLTVIWFRSEPLLRRLVELAEKRTMPPAPEGAAVPPTVVALAAQESEPWAREQALKRARELYSAYGDWDRVATSMLATDLNENLRGSTSRT